MPSNLGIASFLCYLQLVLSDSIINPHLSLFDNLIVNIKNDTNLQQILDDVRQNWEMALHPEVNNVQLHLLLNLPFFSTQRSVDGTPLLSWEGVPKSLSLVTLVTTSSPVTFTDSIVLIASSRGKRDLIMNEIKNVWTNLTAGNLTDIQLEVTGDKPIPDADAYNPDTPPLRSITYRVSGVADKGIDEYFLKQRLREMLNASKNSSVWLVPDLPPLPTPRALLISPKAQAVPLDANLRSIFLHVTGEGVSTLNVTQLRARMRSIIKAFPTDGVWFVPAGDADTALLDASLNDTQIGFQSESTPIHSPMLLNNSMVFIVSNGSSFNANGTNSVSESPILVETAVDSDNAINRIIKSSPFDSIFSWPTLDHLIGSFNKLIDLTGRWFQKSI